MPKYNLKPKKNRSTDGRKVVRSDSRAEGNTTQFTCRGDDLKIGDGKSTFFDFSDTNDDSTDTTGKPIPAGMKRKRIVLSFADAIQIKEGAIYFHNAKKTQYIDFYIVCPDGQTYLDRAGDPQVASGDVIVEHYVNEQYIQSDAPMGDELNTEGANENPIPSTYEIWFEITTPNADTDSNGWATIEMYRPRTVLLPSEAL